MSSLFVTVTRKKIEAEGIVSFELAAREGSGLPPFSAGSHIDVHVKPGVIRQYSLCNDPAETHRYEIAVLKDPASRGGSITLHDTVAEGAGLEISAPRNLFPLVPATRTLLLAGGIGVTPLLCMAERLAVSGGDFTLHYCTRSPERTAYRDRIAASSFAARVLHHYDDGAAAQKFDATSVLSKPVPGTHIYICGPGGFIDFCLGKAREAGWPAEQLHVEYFAAKEVDTTGDGSFTVKCASNGKTLTIPPNRSVAEVLMDNGFYVDLSCEQGVCGVCLTRVLEGECDHRDLFLTEAERAKHDQFTPCCSRAKSSLLVLDI